MLSQWKPHVFLHGYDELTPQSLKKWGIRTILSDLDGTLASENESGDSLVYHWITSLEHEGISLVVVSNNTQERVDAFTKPLGLIGYGHCRKPWTSTIETHLMAYGLDPDTTLFLGDQLFTDVWCGKKLGMKTALVTPIPGRENWKTRIKRTPESWLFRLWREQR